MSGLEIVSVQDMDLLLNTVRDLQKEHHFMNERQLQTMVSVVKETPYANTKEFQNFVHDMQSDMVGRFQSSQMEHENASDVYRQKLRNLPLHVLIELLVWMPCMGISFKNIRQKLKSLCPCKVRCVI